MNKNLRLPIKFGILVLAILLTNLVANAATFTAIASGNWSSSTTWGGTVPSSNNLTDQITIPLGVNVTMNNNILINGVTAQLSVLGSLSSNPNILLNVNTGTVNGSGVITADSLQLGAGAALLFTGALTANTMTTSALNLQVSSIVIVNQNLLLDAGTLSIQNGGSLTFGNNSNIILSGGLLSVNGGTLVLTPTYNVLYTTNSTVAGLELTGAGLQNVVINVGSNHAVTLSNNLTVNGILTITSGNLNLGAHDLTIYGNVGTGAGTITSTIASNINITTTNNIAGTLMFTGNASGVNNFTMNIGSTNQLGVQGALNVNGILALTSGVLYISSSAFVITGDIAASNSGTISPTTSTNMAVNTASTPSNALQFTVGNNTLHNFSVNIGSGSVAVNSNLTILGNLTLTAGNIDIGNNTLVLGNAASIIGANANAYIVTNTSGLLSIPLIAGTLSATLFPIGTSTTYFPAKILLNAGSTSGLIQIGVMAHVYDAGTTGNIISSTQHLVDATWNVNSNISSNLDLSLQLMWATGSELNGFTRATSYISHYTGGAWDNTTVSAATAVTGGMFSSTRTHLTSLSPFSVFDNSTSTGVIDISNMASVEVYPNPSADNISIVGIVATDGVVNIEIRNINGQLMHSEVLANANNKVSIKDLPTGNYFIQLRNSKTTTVKKFIKI